MAEPARKIEDENNSDIAPDIGPNFQVIQGGGETTPDRASLSAAKDIDSPRTTSQPSMARTKPSSNVVQGPWPNSAQQNTANPTQGPVGDTNPSRPKLTIVPPQKPSNITRLRQAGLIPNKKPNIYNPRRARKDFAKQMPKLRIVRDEGQANPPNSNLRAVNNKELNPQKPSQSPIQEQENNPTPSTWANKTTPQAPLKNPNFFSRAKSNKKMLGSVGIGSGLISIPVILLSLLPLKMEMYINNIANIASTYVDSAVQQRAARLITTALAERLLLKPTEQLTGQIVYCKGGGIACSLFATYSDHFIEENLGINLEVSAEGRTQMGGRASKWTVTTSAGDGLDDAIRKIEVGSNGEMKKIIKKEVAQKGKHKSALTRYIARRLMMKRYGVVTWRGPPFVEKAVNSITNAKTNVKVSILKNTVGKVAPRVTSWLTCLGGNEDLCNKLRQKLGTNEPLKAPVNPDEDPELKLGNSDTATEAQKTAYNNAKASYDADLPTINAASSAAEIEVAAEAGTAAATGAESVVDKSVGQSIVKGFLTKRTLAIAGGIGAGAGLLDMIFKAIGAIGNGALENIWYDEASQIYTGLSTYIQTANDKMKVGGLDTYTLGTLQDLFNGAENTPLAQAENGQSVDTSNGITTNCEDDVNNIVPTKLDAGELICPALKLVRNYTHAFDTNPALKALKGTAVSWNKSIGKGFTAFNDASGAILGAIGFDKVTALIGNFAGGAVKSASEWLIGLFIEPPNVGVEASGSNNYVALSGGIRTEKNSMMEEGVDETGQPIGGGGGVLSDPQIAAINSEANQDDQDYYNSQPLLARMFDVNLTGSFLQRFVASLPISVSGLAKLPFTSISSAISGSFASADTKAATINPFGLPLYGYALDDPSLTADPNTYTDDYCATSAKEREASRKVDPVTKIAVYTKTDPCALEKMVVGTELRANGVTDSKYSLEELPGGSTSD